MAPDENTNGWTEWGKHVLSELERLSKNIETLSGRQQATEARVGVLSVWVKIAGALLVAAIGMMIKQALGGGP